MSAPAFAPLFKLGMIVSTPGALDATTESQRGVYLLRHVEDWETNREAIRDGFRILSAYPIDPEQPCQGFGENCVWIITEADRSVTTFLLPSEY
jgi:hypothetical protein